jgi:hypothetical protein
LSPPEIFAQNRGENGRDRAVLAARQLEGLGFIGITLQQPLGLNFRSAWKIIS